MHASISRWTTAVAAAALMALPVAASAQSSATTPPQAPPQPPTQQAAPAQPAAGAAVDAAAAKQHLTEARDTLSQITSMPEAARLQGDARTQVSQVISNFNELITTQANWRSTYTKVDANLTALLGPDGGDPSNTTAAAGGVAALDPAVRAKLAEFRTHLKEFEKATGGDAAVATAPSTFATAGEPAKTTPPVMVTTPGSVGTSGTTPPSPTATAGEPAKTTPPVMVTTPGSVGTSGTTPPSPAATAGEPTKPAAEQRGHADADKELDAISAILNTSKTGALTKAETAQLKKHVEQLRILLNQSK
jgi:hypothetical protein